MAIFSISRLVRFVALVASVGFISSAAQAQVLEVKAKVGKPAFEALPSPIVDTGGVDKRFKPKDWLEVEVEFELDARSSDRETPDFVDELEVKYYVAVENGNRDRSNPANYFLLERTVSHVNIPVGEKIFSSVYLSPSSIKRITGNDRAGKGVVKSVAIQLLYKGRPVGAADTDGRTAKGMLNPRGWFTKLGGDSLVRSEAYPLLAKEETPFALFWWDRYAEPKVDTRR